MVSIGFPTETIGKAMFSIGFSIETIGNHCGSPIETAGNHTFLIETIADKRLQLLSNKGEKTLNFLFLESREIFFIWASWGRRGPGAVRRGGGGVRRDPPNPIPPIPMVEQNSKFEKPIPLYSGIQYYLFF